MLAINIYQLLGGLSPAQFLRDYWQKKPLLIRQAVPNFQGCLSDEELFALAMNDEVESRWISHRASRWQMQHGPLEARRLNPTVKNWTMLVQGLNYFNANANALLGAFRFIPQARLDDIMVSYASDGGGVGAHSDNYDVFLLQGHGQRHWQIAEKYDAQCLANAPLKILTNFNSEEEWTLSPGDMLYLPPGYAHRGVAKGICTTYSIGFRAPTYQELGEGFLEFLQQRLELSGRYSDRDMPPATQAARLPAEMIERAWQALSSITWQKEDVAEFLASTLSEPKPHLYFQPRQAISQASFKRQAGKHAIVLDACTGMLYHESTLFINGEALPMSSTAQMVLMQLADQRQYRLNQDDLQNQDLLKILTDCFVNGFIHLQK